MWCTCMFPHISVASSSLCRLGNWQDTQHEVHHSAVPLRAGATDGIVSIRLSVDVVSHLLLWFVRLCLLPVPSPTVLCRHQ